MAEKISQRVNAIPDKATKRELIALLNAAQADIAALRTVVAALVTDMASRISNHNTLATKLNADAGVTDEDYAAATAITATAPAALTFTQ